MSFIKGRLRRLEERSRGGPCHGCKLSPEGPGHIDLIDENPKRVRRRPRGALSRCGPTLWSVIGSFTDRWRKCGGRGLPLAVRCAGIKRDGSRVRLPLNPIKFCWWHDPANADKRRRAASKAGKAKPSRELAGIKQRLSDLSDDVLAGEVDRAAAAVASQVLNVYLRAVSVELKIREQQEIIDRLRGAREGLEQQKGERRYGA